MIPFNCSYHNRKEYCMRTVVTGLIGTALMRELVGVGLTKR